MVPPTQSNFVWLPLGEQSVPFAQACEAAGIIVRPFAGEGVRVTVGTPEENDAFLTAAESYPRVRVVSRVGVVSRLAVDTASEALPASQSMLGREDVHGVVDSGRRLRVIVDGLGHR